jgi:hypothetical protein
MPNWCENRVYLEASPSEIEAMLAAIQSDDDKGLLNYLRPEHESDQKGIMPNWYNWRIEQWGTKWEVQAQIISYSVSDGWLNIMFDSAWSPPIKAFTAWQSVDPENRNFNIRYIEWGMMFCGEADSRGANDIYHIPPTVAEVQQTVPIDLNEEFGISDCIAQWKQEEA